MLKSNCLMAFLASLSVLCVIALTTRHTPVKDEISYLEVVQDLATHHTFTNGSFAREGERTAPGRFFAPAYPLFVFALTQLDPALGDAVACHTSQTVTPDCGGSFLTLRLASAVLLSLAIAAVFVIARVLSNSTIIAWLAVALSLAFGAFRELTGLILTETISLPAFLGFSACAALWARDAGAWRPAAAAGVLLALAALARPSYLYLFYFVGAVLAVSAMCDARARSRSVLFAMSAFAFSGILVLAPWMLRNFLLFGDAALTHGYAAFTLAQRVAYNTMTTKEWLIAWIYWLPDFGDNLIKSIFGKADYVRLGWTDPSSFYKVGASQVYSDTLNTAGSSEAHLGYLVRHHVFGDLAKHVAVTLPLTMRGIWAGGYLALAGALLTPWFVTRACRLGLLQPLLAVAVPMLFMAGLHGFVSVNIVRYNEALIALYATIVAAFLYDVAERFGWLRASRHDPS